MLRSIRSASGQITIQEEIRLRRMTRDRTRECKAQNEQRTLDRASKAESRHSAQAVHLDRSLDMEFNGQTPNMPEFKARFPIGDITKCSFLATASAMARQPPILLHAPTGLGSVW
jgi:hypothetical protein